MDSSSCCGGVNRGAASAPGEGSRVLGTLPRTRSGSTTGMVLLPGGVFQMGTEDATGFIADGEGPIREITLDPFWIDPCAVTKAEYARFVAATGYQTDADRFGWSVVFHLHIQPHLPFEGRALHTPWWQKVSGSNWAHPEGPGSSIEGREDHPVTHISWNDAAAYCRWAGKRLATEAEWEYAARGGLVGKLYPWGNELTPGGEHRCNIWQGHFPDTDTAEDGYSGTAPVRSYLPNGYGLYQMTGNVWEWCHDWFSPLYHQRSGAPRINPSGPPQPEPDGRRVQRGGSFLCHDSYCNRYRLAARNGNTPDTSGANTGFRCVRDV